MQFCIFEDTHATKFLPLTYFRPVYELRCGVMSLREKIEMNVPAGKVVFHSRKNLAERYAEKYPRRAINAIPDEETWFINGRILADDTIMRTIKKRTSGERILRQGSEIAAAFVKKENVQLFAEQLIEIGINDSAFARDRVEEEYIGTLVRYPWELVHHTAAQIEKDFALLKKTARGAAMRGTVYPGAHLLNKKNVLIGKSSAIKSGAVLDAEHGPIVLGQNVTVMPNAVIEGPTFIGDHSIIKAGAKIYPGTSIGTYCKVGGEVENSIIQSYSNKQHEGFLGHSYLGSWVNIGADTNTSDLKNTYGTVKVQVGGLLIDSGMQFVGLTMGDHSKSGINVMFDTGTVVGVACNIYGAGLSPKFLPSFSWGGDSRFTTYQIDKSLETARRVMARRDVEMTSAYENLFRDVYRLTEVERRNMGIA
ncbi:MAG: GlmU family protein [Ignavibacteria bacterium]|nr:GlmU family protein [Ignavibacteria bacterium]MBI3766835.1 GlmU family protein [Ignavibacteriales bacterium]